MQPPPAVSGVQSVLDVELTGVIVFPLVSVTVNVYVTNEHVGLAKDTVKSTPPVEV